jgi:phosphohistidine phosphatase
MLTLLLMRHAKAESHNSSGDFERALTARGEADARAVGAHIAGLDLLPDLSLVSAARRTQQTFALFAEGAGRSLAGRVEPSFYDADDAELRAGLKDVDPDARTVMIVAHNPGIMDLAIRLARDGDVSDLSRLRGRFPPAALALIVFDAEDWRDARMSGGRLDLLLLPEDLRTEG